MISIFLSPRQSTTRLVLQQTRLFCCSPSVASGHNRWSKISRDKGLKDVEKGKLYSQTANEIVAAGRRGGSSDPNLNLTLFVALRKAKANGVPKDNIERALARLNDKSAADNVHNLVYEAMGPGQTGIIIEASSDNPKRTGPNITKILTKHGARSASVSYLFSKLGSITFERKDGTDADAALEAAIEVGAEDVDITEDGDIEVLTAADSMQTVAEALSKHGSVNNIRSMTLIWRPSTPLERGEDKEEEDKIDESIQKLVEALETDPDTSAVYTTRD